MFGNPYYNNFRENQQQPITQNFQLANNYQNEVELKYLKDSDNPENIMVFRKTLFINSNNMIVKDANGQIIEKYEIKKIFPIDEKDIEIENLKKELEDIIYKLKETDPKCYQKYKMKLYEMAYGKVLTEEMAFNWVQKMKPKGEHWSIEETTNAMQNLGYNLKNIDFYVVANMMYNDYYDLVKDDEELALKMAYMWLNDEDSVKDKLYEYYKYIPKED